MTDPIAEALAQLERSTQDGLEQLERHAQRIKDADTVDELRALMPWLRDHTHQGVEK